MASKTVHSWTEPALCTCKGDITKSWFAYFDFTDGNSGITYKRQIRGGINYYHTPKEREAEGKALVQAIKIKLAEGWNPITKKNDGLVNELESLLENRYTSMLFCDALDFALESKRPNISEKSHSDYRVVKDFAKEAAMQIGLHKLKISEVKRRHIKFLMDRIQQDRQKEYDKEGRGKKFTGNSYNKYVRFLKALFTELEEFEAVEYNPCTRITSKPEIVTNIHRQATVIEEKMIKSHLRIRNIRFYVFLAIEELSGIRPKEICNLHIKDIDRLNQCFNLGATNGKSKTRKARLVPIPDKLLPLIDLLQLEGLPEDYFIFGDNFEPGPKRSPRNMAHTEWRNLVKKELGLKVSLYSFKGLGGEKKREAGIEHGIVSKQFGHSNPAITNIYLPREEERNRRHIMKNTPGFE